MDQNEHDILHHLSDACAAIHEAEERRDYWITQLYVHLEKKEAEMPEKDGLKMTDGVKGQIVPAKPEVKKEEKDEEQKHD